MSSFLPVDNINFFKLYALQNPGCNRTGTCGWQQIKHKRSAEHTLHYCGHDKQYNTMIKTLIKLYKMRGSCNFSHLACGWQMLYILKFILLDSFNAWNSVPIKVKWLILILGLHSSEMLTPYINEVLELKAIKQSIMNARLSVLWFIFD